ncbi:hypothetical protein TNCV_4875941 [Trichonephila clavipes]|nr:hypothetical protein TNCV_4875941 [Trichonephila clavipes]
MNCPTDRETDGRELCLKDRVKILNFKEICFKGDPEKNTHGRNQHWNRFWIRQYTLPLRWALESINGKGKKIGKDLMKRNKRVNFVAGIRPGRRSFPVVPKVVLLENHGLEQSGHLKTTETVLAVAIDKLSSESLEFTKLRILLVLSSSFLRERPKETIARSSARLGEKKQFRVKERIGLK